MFATALTLCVGMVCNTYFVDTDPSWVTPTSSSNGLASCEGFVEGNIGFIKDNDLELYLWSKEIETIESPYDANLTWAIDCRELPDSLIP